MHHPDCALDPSECRIIASAATVTCMAWETVVDGNGRQIDAGDPNITTVTKRCATCAKQLRDPQLRYARGNDLPHAKDHCLLLARRAITKV